MSVIADDLEVARSLHLRGALQDAVDAYRAILRETPERVDALRGYGQVIGQLGDLPLGLQVLGEALRLDPDNAETAIALSELLILGHHPREALGALALAQRLRPEAPRVGTLIASCHELLHDYDAAGAALDAVLARAPDDVFANVTRARLDRLKRRPDAARRRLERVIARGAPTRFHAQRAYAELGAACDALRDHDAAWRAYLECAKVKQTDPVIPYLDRALWPDLAAHYRAEYTAPSAPPAVTPGPFRLAFLVGFPRSGTTMTEQVLAAHPEVTTTDERPYLSAVNAALADLVPESNVTVGTPCRALRHLTEDQIDQLRATYWAQCADACDPNATLFLDKLPLNLVHLGLINTVFPDARVIVALRDPRDVCLSCFFQEFQLNAAMVHFLSIESTAQFYATVMESWLAQRERFRVPTRIVHYEDTVTDLEAQARRLVDHLDLPWSAAMLRFHEAARTRAISTPSSDAVTRPIHRDALARWRHYEAGLSGVLPTLTPLAATLRAVADDDF